jgi:hypothetical protein
MIKRQRIDQRPKAQPFGALRDGGEKDARRRRHAERRRVMLGEMIGVETGAVVKLDQLQPGLVIIPQRQVITIEVIENSKFHILFPDGETALQS